MRIGGPSGVPGFRALGLFWATVLGVGAVGAVILQALGPPSPRSARHDVAALAVAPAKAPTRPAATRLAAKSDDQPPKPTQPSPLSARPGREMPGPIAAPIPALLEPSKDFPGAALPRIAADGRTASQVYARGFDRGGLRPRTAVIMAGVGLNAADSEDAIRTLPGEITLAVSPYANHPDRLLEAARSTGHEFLMSLPMEPQSYPLNDAGDHALLTGATPDQNRQRLDWALTRIAGYAGATNALGLLRGERFAGAAAQMDPVLQTLASRGLFYIDARPGQSAPQTVWGRTVDLVIDEPAVRLEIEAKLAQLEQIARDKGSAIGLVGAVRPVTVDRLAAWSNTLAAKGLALAPASALVREPALRSAAQ